MYIAGHIKDACKRYVKVHIINRKKRGEKAANCALAVSKEIAAQFENQKKREAANW
jgi:hypothetical protein